jgi:hypothetical protein
MFLTDRSVLKRHALKTIHGAISAADTNVQVCSWRWTSYDDVIRCELDDIPVYNNNSAQMLSSQLIVEDFVEGKKCYSLPLAPYSCYRKDLVTSLRERYGTFFRPISPDYTAAFLLLANINAVLYIDQALFILQGWSFSNGRNAYVKTGAAYLQTLGDRDWFPHVPIKSPLVENSIFQDYLSIRDLAGGTLSKVDINWPVYFEKCYRELIVKTGMGLLSSEEIEGLYAEWSKALAGFDHSVQDEVNRRIKGLRWVKLKERLRGSAIGPIVFRLRRKVDSVWHRGWQTVRGQSVLEAAGFRGEF